MGIEVFLKYHPDDNRQNVGRWCRTVGIWNHKRGYKKLIESNFPVIRVVAGPETGKTTCLKSRTQRFVEGDKVDPLKIFVGTFTRAITKKTKEKLAVRSAAVSSTTISESTM